MVPDSLKRTFRTAHGRRVLDAGGIEPDTVVVDEENGKIIDELLRKAMFFKFANQYAVAHKTLPENFEVSDDLLKDFEAFLQENKFQYQEQSEVKLKELKQIAERERYKKSFVNDVDQLESMVETEKQRTIQRYQKEMKSFLKTEIEGRINGENARIESTFPDDYELNVTVLLLKNRKVYDRLLAVGTDKASKRQD
jgi:carboxyl-terminal processing protease